jgi:hypothetical protein
MCIDVGIEVRALLKVVKVLPKLQTDYSIQGRAFTEKLVQDLPKLGGPPRQI